MTDSLPLTIEDPWPALKQFTPARIALGHTGVSLPTGAYLDFQLAHALARDAVSIPLDFDRLEQRLNGRGYQTLLLQTQAESHQAYLQRPDLGRLLNPASVITVQQAAHVPPSPQPSPAGEGAECRFNNSPAYTIPIKVVICCNKKPVNLNGFTINPRFRQ